MTSLELLLPPDKREVKDLPGRPIGKVFGHSKHQHRHIPAL